MLYLPKELLRQRMISNTERVISAFQGRPKAAILMSLGGSNARSVVTDPELRDLYDFRAVVTDNPGSGAQDVASHAGIEYLPLAQGKFASPEARYAYFETMRHELGARGIAICIYAGFMKVAKGPILSEMPGVNTHPADLTIVDSEGIPLYRGMDAVSLMRSGTGGYVASSTHVVESKVDTGATFMRSLPVLADKDLSDTQCHDMILKPIERAMYPVALRMLANGALELSKAPYTYNNGVVTPAGEEK